MQKNIVITISREYGSGGRQIGKLLAEKLGVDFYDQEIIELAAKQSGLNTELMQQTEEMANNGLLHSLSYLGMLGYSLSLYDQIFIAQSKVIREAAEKGSCVIVGRCADYVLKDNPNCLNVFVYADIGKRVKLATELYGLPDENAEQCIAKIDKQRETYYNHYTKQKWGQASNYHLTIDRGITGIEGSVEVISAFLAQAEKTNFKGAYFSAKNLENIKN